MSCVLRKLCCYTDEMLTKLPGPIPGPAGQSSVLSHPPLPRIPRAGRADRFQGRASLSSWAIYVSSCGDMWRPSPSPSPP